MTREFTTLTLCDALGFATLFTTLVLFKRLGLGNDETTLLTSLLFTPWIAYPLLARWVGKVRQVHLLIIADELACSLLLVTTAVLIDEGASSSAVAAVLWLLALCVATHSVAVGRLAESNDAHNVRRMRAIRFVALFLSLVVCQGLLVAFAGSLEVLTRTVRYPWSVAFYMLTALFAVLTLLHGLTLRSGEHSSPPQAELEGASLFTLHSSLFTLLALLSEGLFTQTGQLFLIDARHNGGLGLSPAEYGLTQGTVAVVALLVGGTMALRKKWDLTCRLCLSSIALATAVSSAVYIYLSHSMNVNILIVSLCLFVRSLTLGFSLTISYRWLKDTLHSSLLSSALVSLPLVIGGMASGQLQESVGYRFYFIAVACFAAAMLTVAAVCLWRKKENIL